MKKIINEWRDEKKSVIRTTSYNHNSQQNI